MDYRFIKPDNWKYIIDVLKIKDIFCFFSPTESNINFYLHNYQIKVFYQGLLNVEEFSKQITYRIVNTIKNHISTNEIVPEKPEEFYMFCKNSKRFAPRYNIKETNDPNFLVLGKITWYYVGKSVFIQNVSEFRDVALDIILYTFNILKKKLGSDIYRHRICSYMIDAITKDEFILVRDTWQTPKRRIIPFLNSLLRNAYPARFPKVVKEGKERATSIYDTILLNIGIKEYNLFIDELKQEEAWALQAMREEEEENQREKDEKQMLEDFWNDLGDNYWNID